jgi:hypothetical protein
MLQRVVSVATDTIKQLLNDMPTAISFLSSPPFHCALLVVLKNQHWLSLLLVGLACQAIGYVRGVVGAADVR